MPPLYTDAAEFYEAIGRLKTLEPFSKARCAPAHAVAARKSNTSTVGESRIKSRSCGPERADLNALPIPPSPPPLFRARAGLAQGAHADQLKGAVAPPHLWTRRRLGAGRRPGAAGHLRRQRVARRRRRRGRRPAVAVHRLGLGRYVLRKCRAPLRGPALTGLKVVNRPAVSGCGAHLSLSLSLLSLQSGRRDHLHVVQQDSAIFPVGTPAITLCCAPISTTGRPQSQPPCHATSPLPLSLHPLSPTNTLTGGA